MCQNLNISVIKKWAKDANLEMVKVVEGKQGLICMIPIEDVLIPLIIRLDGTGFIVFSTTVVRDIQNDLQLFQKALEMSATVPAKICLSERDLILVMDIRVHQGFNEKDFQEALGILRPIIEHCYWTLKFIVRETRKSNDLSDGPSEGANWPDWLLSVN